MGHHPRGLLGVADLVLHHPADLHRSRGIGRVDHRSAGRKRSRGDTAHYGSTTFNLDSVNGTSPSLVAGDGGELVEGNFFRSQVVSIPSAPAAGDEFAIAYGSTAPAVP